MRLLKWLESLVERWTQSEMDRYFATINPQAIKDIDQVLRSKGWM